MTNLNRGLTQALASYASTQNIMDDLDGMLFVEFGANSAVVSRDREGHTVVTAFQSAISECQKRLAEKNMSACMINGELVVDDETCTPQQICDILSQG